MDQVLALQYRRRGKRLQMLVLPYSFDISGAALIRFLSPSDHTPDSVKGWRVIPIVGMAMTMKINGLADFEADAMMKEVFESPWMRPEGLYIEAKGFVDTRSWDFSDLVGGRVPRDLLTRVHEQIDNWV